MANADTLAYMSAARIARLIRDRELSPVDVVNAQIARIEDRNPSLNAFVHFRPEEARRRANEAERAVLAGEQLGPLHGVPTAMKDLFDFKPGWISTFGGIRAFKDFVAPFYSGYPERIEKAGAILLGKTNSPTLGFRGTCDNYLFGPTRNPFNLSKNSGGSSGGSAAAVADGLVPFAEGSDAGGSIRIPAAWCGVYGFKPSFGRVPFVMRPNAFGAGAPFISEGVISRTVEDAALALGALAGYDARDPFSQDDPIDGGAALRRGVKDWKIAYSPNWDGFPVEAEVAAQVRAAVGLFERAGARVEEVRVGIKRSHEELTDLWCRLIMPLTHQTFDFFRRQGVDLLRDHRADLPPQLLEWAERTARQSVAEFFSDQEMRSEVFDAVQGIFQKYDLLVTPTLGCLPVDNASDGNTVGPSEIGGVPVDPLIGWGLAHLVNFIGSPAASIPAGSSASGLPIGMQIIGKRHGDLDVLTASASFEQLQPWQDAYRHCASRSIERN